MKKKTIMVIDHVIFDRNGKKTGFDNIKNGRFQISMEDDFGVRTIIAIVDGREFKHIQKISLRITKRM
jgi:hypothetical protein